MLKAQGMARSMRQSVNYRIVVAHTPVKAARSYKEIEHSKLAMAELVSSLWNLALMHSSKHEQEAIQAMFLHSRHNLDRIEIAIGLLGPYGYSKLRCQLPVEVFT